jgi:hypothetical protein
MSMRAIVRVLCTVLVLLVVHSCKKWSDPAPVTDSRLVNPYCNDPEAVNFNWGFPGKPDNSICFYPTDIFKGTYQMIDSVYNLRDGFFMTANPVTLRLFALSKKKLALVGFCGLDTIRFTATPTYVATLDTLIGDSLTIRGQYWCRMQDTVNGTISYNRLDSFLYVNLIVTSDSGEANHTARARRQ